MSHEFGDDPENGKKKLSREAQDVRDVLSMTNVLGDAVMETILEEALALQELLERSVKAEGQSLEIMGGGDFGHTLLLDDYSHSCSLLCIVNRGRVDVEYREKMEKLLCGTGLARAVEIRTNDDDELVLQPKAFHVFLNQPDARPLSPVIRDALGKFAIFLQEKRDERQRASQKK